MARKCMHIMRNGNDMFCQDMGIGKRWRGGGLKGREGSWREKARVLKEKRGFEFLRGEERKEKRSWEKKREKKENRKRKRKT